MLPFIKKFQSDGNYVFWPYLASSHYSEASLDFMIENSKNHVEKFDNPANLPETRPIEDFLSILKGRVYANGMEAKSLLQLKLRIKKCLSEINAATIQSLLEGIKGRIDKIRRNNIIEKLKFIDFVVLEISF